MASGPNGPVTTSVIIPIRPDRCAASARAPAWGRYPISAATDRILRRVAAETLTSGRSVRTNDTVVRETPTRRAISSILTRGARDCAIVHLPDLARTDRTDRTGYSSYPGAVRPSFDGIVLAGPRAAGA